MRIATSGREYAHFPIAGVDMAAPLEVTFDGATWHPLERTSETEARILVAGPEATGNPTGTVVLGIGYNLATIRLVDNPEQLLRSADSVLVASLPTGIDSFATPELMEARSQGAIPATHPFLPDALRAATALIRRFCGWHIAGEITETIVLDDTAGSVVSLPSLRIAEVLSLTINGEEADLTGFHWFADGRLREAYTIPTYRRAELTLRHGYPEVPIDLTDLTLQIAARALGSPLGVVREQAGAVSVTYSQAGFNIAGGTVLLAHEKAQLSAYRVGWTA